MTPPSNFAKKIHEDGGAAASGLASTEAEVARRDALLGSPGLVWAGAPWSWPLVGAAMFLFGLWPLGAAALVLGIPGAMFGAGLFHSAAGFLRAIWAVACMDRAGHLVRGEVPPAPGAGLRAALGPGLRVGVLTFGMGMTFQSMVVVILRTVDGFPGWLSLFFWVARAIQTWIILHWMVAATRRGGLIQTAGHGLADAVRDAAALPGAVRDLLGGRSALARRSRPLAYLRAYAAMTVVGWAVHTAGFQVFGTAMLLGVGGLVGVAVMGLVDLAVLAAVAPDLALVDRVDEDPPQLEGVQGPPG